MTGRLSSFTYLLLLSALCSRAIVRFLEEYLLHFAVLQVVQLSHSIFSARNQIHHHSYRTLTTQEMMLRGKTDKKHSGQKERLLGTLIISFIISYRVITVRVLVGLRQLGFGIADGGQHSQRLCTGYNASSGPNQRLWSREAAMLPTVTMPQL